MVNISKTYHFFSEMRSLWLEIVAFLLVLGLFVVACGWWVLD